MEGKIVRFNSERGFGFIEPSGGGEEMFFHISEVTDRDALIEEGTRVEFEAGINPKDGRPRARKVRIISQADENLEQGPSQPIGQKTSMLFPECIFDSFYDEDGHLKKDLFYSIPKKVAKFFLNARLKSSQFRQLYDGFRSFAVPLRDGRIDFASACERFGVFYVERVVRQVARNVLPPVVKELIDAHKEVALSSKEEMMGLFRYITNVYCFFDDGKKKFK